MSKRRMQEHLQELEGEDPRLLHEVETAEMRRAIGQRLREARIKRGLSAQDLASPLHWSAENLLRLESGEVGTNITTLARLARLLNANITISPLADVKLVLRDARKGLRKRPFSAAVI